MKRILGIVLLVFSALYLGAQPKIEFGKTTHDYGKINEEAGLAETVFEFTNTGNAPLILNNVKATCGCTTPEWSKEPIAPGGKSTIKVGYNPQNRPGAFNKNVNVYSNTQPSVTVLTIMGEVIPRKPTMEEEYPRELGQLRFKSNYLSLGTMLNTEKKTDKLEFINNSTTPAKMGVYRTTPYITATFEPETVQPGKAGTMVITYDATKNIAFGYVSDRIYFTINDVKDNSYSVGVSVALNEDFSKLTPDQLAKAPVAEYDKTTFDFGNIKENEKVSTAFKLKNSGKTDLLIRNVKASCGCTAVKHENVVAPGQTIDLNVEFNSRGKKGRQNKTVTVITNDPKNATVQLRIMGTVEAAANSTN
jgi:hypothetical protein